MEGHAQVMTATGTRDDAKAIARAALQARMAACVQIVGPIESLYWWEGELEAAEEWLCLLKTSADRVDGLCETIRAHHRYDTPEITVTPIVGGSPAYLAWIEAETRRSR